LQLASGFVQPQSGPEALDSEGKISGTCRAR
jgi:hypothetical protein